MRWIQWQVQKWTSTREAKVQKRIRLACSVQRREIAAATRRLSLKPHNGWDGWSAGKVLRVWAEIVDKDDWRNPHDGWG